MNNKALARELVALAGKLVEGSEHGPLNIVEDPAAFIKHADDVLAAADALTQSSDQSVGDTYPDWMSEECQQAMDRVDSAIGSLRKSALKLKRSLKRRA